MLITKSAAQKDDVQISRIQKKQVAIFDRLKMDERADGDQKS